MLFKGRQQSFVKESVWDYPGVCDVLWSLLCPLSVQTVSYLSVRSSVALVCLSPLHSSFRVGVACSLRSREGGVGGRPVLSASSLCDMQRSDSTQSITFNCGPRNYSTMKKFLPLPDFFYCCIYNDFIIDRTNKLPPNSQTSFSKLLRISPASLATDWYSWSKNIPYYLIRRNSCQGVKDSAKEPGPAD